MKKVSREEKIKELLKTGFFKPEELELFSNEILNDLYLKRLIEIGQLPIEKCERPFVTYYPYRPIKILDINKSLYDTYVEKNKDNPNGVAIYNLTDDRILYHKEVKELTDAFARGLMEYGVDIDSKVGIIANDATEEPMSLLSPNALGAKVKFFDYFKGPIAIKNDIEKHESDILFIDEMFIDWEPIINEKGLPVVILNATKDYSNPRCIPFDKIVALGASKNTEDLQNHKNKVDQLSPERTILEINSSGTTGAPKPIEHSTKTVNSAVQKLFFTDFPYGRNSYVLKAIPSQLALGSITTLYASLTSGTGTILIRPETKEAAFDMSVEVIQKFKKIMKKYGLSQESILMNFASPMFYRAILEQLRRIDDMTFIGGQLAAGNKMNENELKAMNAAFRSKGCKVPVSNAYGQNELAGAVTMNTPNHDVPGSAGYPVIGTKVRIIDKELREKLPTNAAGNIIEQATTEFLGYSGMPEKTQQARIELDGEKWFDTNDIGRFDQNGFLHVTGRDSRVITNSDFKINLDIIQDKLSSLGIFKDVAVVPLKKDPDEFPVLFGTLKQDYISMSVAETKDRIQSLLGPYEMPVKIIIVDKLPALASGKIDYKSIESIIESLPDLPNGKVDFNILASTASIEINQHPKLKIKK